ncbi:MAG: hypothetical protein J0L70_08355 [Leptolyngbya sp. UWPOB_LEPTO1]|uniref:hypothetical protein n=1 Tax=Leptolyngbya sp. UWPOB_LEPTO1 TaxID=2815653 RepID=UPI001AC5CECE|nr:hypothetical protein [Leptolyngbya sp. UWPOB_LEPTO1]MBN8560517.1 hypothetical protein [Leptolyngbya sp. UWPOB_LEPTO1]
MTLSKAPDRKFMTSLFYIVISLIGTLMMYSPTILSGFTKIQAERGDTRILHYFLEHSFQLLVNRNYTGTLWSPSFFYPFKNALAFSENLFGCAPIYWLFRSVLNPDHAFQLWMITIIWLCFAAFVIVLRRLRVSPVLSGFGGFLFAFGLPRAAKLGHHQLFPQFFTPIAFLCVWRFIQKPTSNRLRWALTLIYLQLLAAVYLGWFLVFSLLVFLPVMFWLDRDFKTRITEFLKRTWKETAIALLVWSGAVIALFLPYLEISKVIGKKPYSEIASMLPRLQSWLLPADGSLWRPWLFPLSAHTPMVHEHQIFLGFVILGVTGFALYVLKAQAHVLDPERKLLAQACLLTFGIIFLLSLSVFDYSLWKFIAQLIPGANSVRAVSRIALMMYFYLLLGVLLCVDAYLKHRFANPKIRTAIALSLILLTLPEQIVWTPQSFDRMAVLQPEAELQSLMQKDCSFAYVALSGKDAFYNEQTQAMWAGMRANVPVINGYSGADPPGLPMRQNIPLSGLLEWLHTASGGKAKGRLCLIQATTGNNQPGRDLPASSIAGIQTFQSGGFTSFVIPVPPNSPLPDYAQAIRIITTPPTQMRVKSAITLPVLVRNTGDFTWFRSGNTPVNFSYRWINEKSQSEPIEYDRTPLPFDLPPNQAVALNAKITAPNRAGQYTLRLTMVQESVTWFDAKTKALDIPVQVGE